MIKKWLAVMLAVVMVLTIAAGCGKAPENQAGQQGNGQASKELEVIDKPTTLKVYYAFDDELYTKFFEEPIKKKFPNVTLERLKPEKGGYEGMNMLLTSGTVPDVFFGLPGWYGRMKMLDVFADLNPLVQKYQFDLNKLHPTVLETAKSYAEGRLDFIPESMTTTVLYYNKSIFDKFGVEYPKDGMTWEQVTDLARKVTKSQDGIQYRGLEMDRFFPINNSQLSLQFYDMKTNKATANTEGWQKYLSMASEIYQIPGNTPKTIGGVQTFMNDKNVAMVVGRLEILSQLAIINDPDLNRQIHPASSFFHTIPAKIIIRKHTKAQSAQTMVRICGKNILKSTKTSQLYTMGIKYRKTSVIVRI